MLLARWGGNRALVIAVGEPRCKFSQIALPDCLTAERTERLRAGCPAIHQDKFHMPPPRSVSCVWTRVASRQQRKLQMRSLQRKFIREPPRLQDPLHPSPRKAAVNELVWLKPIVNPISVAEGGSPIRDLRLLIGLCR